MTVSLAGPSVRLALAAVGTILAVALVRPAWILPLFLLQRRAAATGPSARAPSWQMMAGVSWAGMRGVVTVAAAFSIPETLGGNPFPARAEPERTAVIPIMKPTSYQAPAFATA